MNVTVLDSEPAASIWFEICGVVDPGKKIDFFPEKFRFFRQLHKEIDFLGKNWLFTASSGLFSLFLFKTRLFRSYFLYMTRYNNISRPIHDPSCDSPQPTLRLPRPPCPKSGGSRPPIPPRMVSLTVW